MDADLIAKGGAVFAPLSQFGLLTVSGVDARGFLHAQLSNDIEHLPADGARQNCEKFPCCAFPRSRHVTM